MRREPQGPEGYWQRRTQAGLLARCHGAFHSRTRLPTPGRSDGSFLVEDQKQLTVAGTAPAFPHVGYDAEHGVPFSSHPETSGHGTMRRMRKSEPSRSTVGVGKTNEDFDQGGVHCSALEVFGLFCCCCTSFRPRRGNGFCQRICLFFQGRKNQSPAASETHEPRSNPTYAVPNGHKVKGTSQTPQ